MTLHCHILAFSALTLLVGRQKERPACRNWVMRCWCSYLSGARCRLFAYGPAAATVCNNPVVFCGLTQSPSCDCGQRQTTNHIVDTCPLTQYEGGLNLLRGADDDAVMWLESAANCCTREINSDLQYLV